MGFGVGDVVMGVLLELHCFLNIIMGGLTVGQCGQLLNIDYLYNIYASCLSSLSSLSCPAGVRGLQELRKMLISARTRVIQSDIHPFFLVPE